MSKKTMEQVAAARLKKALTLLDEQQLSGFLEEMAALGAFLQTKPALPYYKGHEQNLKQALQQLRPELPALLNLNPRQAQALEALQTAWQDQSLAHLKEFQFVDDPNTPGPANSCHISRLPDEPYWLITPFNADGVRQPPLDLNTLDSDVSELLDQKKQNHPISPARLLHALRRSNLASLDQRNLRTKAGLSKTSRRRIHLGLAAFKLLCPEEEAKENVLTARIINQALSPAEIAQIPANTYVVLRPQNHQKGRIWYFTAPGKKHEIHATALHELLEEKPHLRALQDALAAPPSLFVSQDSELFTQHFDKKIRRLLLDYHFRELDEAAAKAIRNYKTGWQKVMSIFENTVAALASLNYGAVSVVATLIGLFVAAGISWANPLLAIAGIVLLSGAVVLPFFSTWTNWKFFSTYLSNFFGKIGAEYREIQTPTKKALFWGLTVFALATGIASGALAYTATIALPALLGLSTVSFIFPPLGVTFAAAIAISQSVSFIRSFCDILRKENSWNTFKKPFVEVSALLRNNQAGPGRRLATWLMVGSLTLFAALGLAMSCFTSTRSVGKFFIDQFKTAPQKALLWGICISGVASFLSRIYVTVSSAMYFSMWVCKRLFQGAKAIPLKKALGVASDSVLSGLFYFWSMINLSQKTPDDLQHDVDIHLSGLGPTPTAVLATAGLLTAGTRALSINMKHAGKPDPLEEARQAATTQRVKKVQSHYLEKNPHFIFTHAEAKDETPPYEALSSATFAFT